MGKKSGFSYYISLLLWLTFFFVIPTLIIVVFSFLKKAPYGGVIFWDFDLGAYASLFDKIFLKIVFRTIEISIWVTVITLILALPAAYFISRSKLKNLWLLLVIIPFWTNFLVRIYSFIAILGNNGIVNKTLQFLFHLDEPIQLLYNQNAVIIVTVYIFLPYAILPLYSSIEKFDFSLLDAAPSVGVTTVLFCLNLSQPAAPKTITRTITISDTAINLGLFLCIINVSFKLFLVGDEGLEPPTPSV